MPLATGVAPLQECPITEDSLVLSLIVITFGLTIALGASPWVRAGKARREHHPSAAEPREGPERPNARPAAAFKDQPQAKEFT